MGRPTKMTNLVVKKLEEAFALGCTDLEACFYADITKQTLYTYQQSQPEFLDRKEALKQRPVLEARRSVINHFKDSGNLALRYLEHKQKDEFFPKPQDPVDIGRESQRTLRAMSDDEFDKVIAIYFEKAHPNSRYRLVEKVDGNDKVRLED
jgi:hypothetical protein